MSDEFKSSLTVEKLEEIFEVSGVTPLARKLEKRVSTVQSWKDRGYVPIANVNEIAQLAGLTIAEILSPNPPKAAERARDVEAHYRLLERATRDPQLVYVPFLNVTASAGGGFQNEEYETPNTFLAFRRTWIEEEIGDRHTYAAAIKVKGNSMEPKLCSGDVVLVDTTITSPEPGDVMIVWTAKDGLKVKRVEKREGSWWATSDNEQTTDEPKEFETSEENFRGRVFWRGGEV